MTKLNKILLAGIAAAGFGIASIPASANMFEAQQGCGARNFDPSSPAFAAQRATHQAALHDKLGQTADGALTPAQEAAWTTFTAKMTATAPQGKPNLTNLSTLHAPERMQSMLDMMKSRESAMAERLAAVKEFYAVLTPAQQSVFDQQFAGRARPGMTRQPGMRP
jgi:periplasmic protein CpxP/Spy